MGTSRITDLPLDGGDPDTAREIGREAAEVEIRLMRSDWAGDELRFVEEVPAVKRVDRCHERFNRGKEQTEPENHSWFRLVVQVPGGMTEAAVQAGKRGTDHLVVSYTPISAAWASYAPFRRPNSDGKNPFELTGFESAADFVRAIEALPYDYFETGKYVTAGLSYPAQPFLDDARYRRHDAWLTFGLCADPKDTIGRLFESPRAAELLERTESDRLRFTGPHAGDGAVSLYPEVKAAANTLLLCAICQALAGPDDEDQGKWVGEPVMKLAEWNYYGHLNNANRREATGEKNQKEFLDKTQRLYEEHLRNRKPEARSGDVG